MRKRIYYIVPFTILLICFILGSFFDFQISSTIVDKNNVFYAFISAIGMTPLFILLTFLSGMLFKVTFIDKEMNKWLKALMYLACAGCFIVSVIFSGVNFIGENGLFEPNNTFLKILPLIAFTVVYVLIFYLGYRFAKRNIDPKLWLKIFILMIVLVVGFFAFTVLLKFIIHRPRYRLVSNNVGIAYHPWWQSCSNYKDYISQGLATRDDFKSFPSGHATNSLLFGFGICFIPRLVPCKNKKLPYILYGIGMFVYLLVSFGRLFKGDHYFSDVSMGGLIACVSVFIGNEVFDKVKFLNDEKDSGLKKESQNG